MNIPPLNEYRVASTPHAINIEKPMLNDHIANIGLFNELKFAFMKLQIPNGSGAYDKRSIFDEIGFWVTKINPARYMTAPIAINTESKLL